MFVNGIDSLCKSLETKFGLYLSSLILSALLLILASLYATPVFKPINHGVYFVQLSTNPFDISSNNPMQYRILTPLIGYILFLRGESFLILPLIMGWLLLATVYIYSRKQGFEESESLAFSSLLAFSSPILFLLHFQGYVDTTSYLLVILAIIFQDKPWVWPLFFSLSVVNHESNCFLLPWFLFLMYYKRTNLKNIAKSLVVLTFMFSLIMIYRKWVDKNVSGALSAGFYLQWPAIKFNISRIARFFSWGCFEAFKLFWFFPLLTCFEFFVLGRYRDIMHLALIILCAMFQLILASDTSRLMGLAFPSILFSAMALKELWGSNHFKKWIWLVIILNFFVPQYYVGQECGIPFLPSPISVILKYCIGFDPWESWWI